MTRSLGLFGSGEFLPWAEPVDRMLIERSSVKTDKVVVLPLASAPEGDETFDRWASMGMSHYRKIGAAPVVLPIKTREDAMRPEHVDALDEAALIFFSGGNPGYCCRVLPQTPFWEAVVAAVEAGVSIGGCSAGAVMLGNTAPDVKPDLTFEWVDGLRLFPDVVVGAHWDMLDSYRPGLREQILQEIPSGILVVGIDEDTAIVGDGMTFTVHGNGGVELIPPGKRYESGEELSLEEIT